MNELSKLLQGSNVSTSRQQQFDKKSKSGNSTLIDALRLKRLRRELIASKKGLVALDCEFAVTELEKDKELLTEVKNRQESKELIQSYLRYGFDSESNIVVPEDVTQTEQIIRIDNGGDMTNQMIKKIVMNRKEQIGEVVKDGNYS